MQKPKCPLCEETAEVIGVDFYVHSIKCQICRNYKITREALEDMNSKKRKE